MYSLPLQNPTHINQFYDTVLEQYCSSIQKVMIQQKEPKPQEDWEEKKNPETEN